MVFRAYLQKHPGNIPYEEPAKEAGVSLNIIRVYERKSKDLNKAGFDIVMKLAKVRKCDVEELYG